MVIKLLCISSGPGPAKDFPVLLLVISILPRLLTTSTDPKLPECGRKAFSGEVNYKSLFKDERGILYRRINLAQIGFWWCFFCR